MKIGYARVCMTEATLQEQLQSLEGVRKDSTSGLTHVKALFNRNKF